MSSRILVIEGDGHTRALLERFLGGRGHEVLLAPIADEGVELFTRHRPELVILNSRLEGTTGREVLAVLRRLSREVVLVMMGPADEAALVPPGGWASIGLDMFLPRPFGGNKLLEALDAGRAQRRVVLEAATGALLASVPPAPVSRARQVRVARTPSQRQTRQALAGLQGGGLIAAPQPSAGASTVPMPIITQSDLMEVAEAIEPLDASVSGFEEFAELSPDADFPWVLEASASVPPGALLAPNSGTVEVEVDFDSDDVMTSGLGPLDAVWEPSAVHTEGKRLALDVVPEAVDSLLFQPMVPAMPNDPCGIYGAVDLPQLLYNCFRDLFSGQLLLRHGRTYKTIFLVSGRPINAISNLRAESLGYRLEELGLITEAQREESLRLVREQGVRQGEALVSMGVMTRADVDDQLRQQVRARLLACFGWTDASYGLTYDPKVGERVDAFELNPVVVVFDGIRNAMPIAPLVTHFDGYNRRICQQTPKLEDHRRTTLKTFVDALQIADLCDGVRTLGEVLALSPLGLIETLRILRAFEITGGVSFGEQASPEVAKRRATASPQRRMPSMAPPDSMPRPVSGRMPSGVRPAPATSRAPVMSRGPVSIPPTGQGLRVVIEARHASMGRVNHYELLGVPTNASADRVRRAHARLSQAFDLKAITALDDPSLVTKCREILQRLDEALKQLTVRDARVAYDAHNLETPPPELTGTGIDLTKADGSYRTGRICLGDGENVRALRYFEIAAKQDPHQALYRMYLGWARFVVADKEDRRTRSQAHEEVRDALVEEPKNDEGVVLLAHMYRSAGKQTEALKLYQRALDINRRNSAAIAAIQQLEGDAAQPESFFGKLLKR